MNSFCEECQSWTPEFRKVYLRNKRSLFLKSVSKKNKEGISKAKRQLQVDDAASTASQESVVSPPVVILPLDQQLVDANLSLEDLQKFQHVDNVVELQFQPVSSPPPPATVSVDASFIDKVNSMMEAFNEFRPILRELGSARRSPTAGSSDIVRPNPTDKVSDTAPQGPVVGPQSSNIAPGPSSASLEPRASGSGLHSDLCDDKFASPRGDLDKGDQHIGVRHASPPPSPSHQERLREELECVHTQISHIREINDFCRARGRAPPDQSQDDLENLQSKYAQLSLALEESLYASSSHRRGASLAFASHQVVSPSDAAPLRPDSSSPHGPRRSARPRSPSHDRSRSRDDYSGHLRHSRRSQERYVERFVPSDAPSHSRRPRLRGPPSPRHQEFTRESPSQHQMRFASRRSPSQHQRRFASRSSSPKRMGFASDAGPSSSRRPLSRDSRSPRPRSSMDSLSPRRGSPSPKRRRYESRDSASPQRQHSSRASSREASQETPFAVLSDPSFFSFEGR